MISLNLDEVQKDVMGELKEQYGDMLAKRPVEEALNTLKELVERSPVKTGYYRAGHDIGIGSPSKYRPRSPYRKQTIDGKLKRIRVRRRYANPLTRAKAKLMKYRPGQSIFISNRTYHGHWIEYGSVKMRARGLYALAEQNALSRLAARTT